MPQIAGPSGTANNVGHDYTEGASPMEIVAAVTSNRKARRASQYSAMDPNQGDGSVFSGPGHMVNPSSVSRMSRIELGRRNSDGLSRSRSRHRSRDSRQSSAVSVATKDSKQNGQWSSDGEVEVLDGETSVAGSRRGRPEPAPRVDSPPQRQSVFGNISALFGRSTTEDQTPGKRRRSFSQRSTYSRRSSRSRRSDAGSENALLTDGENDEERWGYSSGEEAFSDEDSTADVMDIRNETMSVTASMHNGSDPGSPDLQATLPLLGADQFFGGETRIEMEVSFESLGPPPSGAPSRQTVYISDEDNTVRLIGYEAIVWRSWAWRVCCVISVGILALLGHWFPRMWLRWVAKERGFAEIKEGFIVVETVYRDIVLFPLKHIPYPYHITTVFPGPTTPGTSSPASSIVKDSSSYDEDTQMLKILATMDYRYSRYALDPRSGLFIMIRDWRDPTWVNIPSVQQGLQSDIRNQRLTLFGRNEINIEGKSTVSLLVDEVIHPFYVFQIASIILWSLDNYYYYAFCIALISVISITTTLIETKQTIARMQDMSKFSCPVDVLLNEQWVTRESSDLVPGDIINLSTSQLSLVPSDMFLLSGDAIVNESMLTGESVPVSKSPAKDDDLVKWKSGSEENARAFLYGGTRVVRVRGAVSTDATASRPAIAIVARTGFNTTKGALIRSMLYPKPIGFKFYRDSVRFIGVLAGIACMGFSVSAVQFVRIGLPWHTIVIRALDLITVVVPPALPATLSIGTSFALSRLRKLGIFCISPSRVNVAGKVNVCCFDKTGTLTEDGLDILGVRGVDRHISRFGELLDNVHDVPLGNDKATFLHALATCHSLKMVDGEALGDPLDVKMFEFTKWTLEEGRVAGTGVIKAKTGAVIEQTSLVQTVVRPPGSSQFRVEDALKGSSKHAHFLELGVIRTFEFVSALRRMSVIVKRLKSSSMEIYVKGAPEVMVDICDKGSLPHDYEDLLSYYTKRGYRVIAIAGKSVDGLSWLKAQRMKREQAESGLKFLGLIIFENKIKPGTAPAMQEIRNAHLACRMITGDNPLTAVSVARECGLINPDAYVFAPTFIQGDATTPLSKLEWTNMDDTLWKLDDYSLKPLTPPPHHAVEVDTIEYQDFSLVVTGDVFRWMINHAPLETLQRMLVKTQIFARMSPDEKNEVVERLQTLGYTVLMCGDGANDCAALKSADVGISLSEAEASIAAPFTSNTPDIGCVIELIKEGRAALVTSFSCFKYMALYSMIQFTTVTLLYWFASTLGDFQFLYIDLFIIIPVAVTMGRTLPYPRIHTKRPTASLVSKKVLSSIIGQIIVTSAAQIWIYLWVKKQSWYLPPPDPSSDEGNQLESTNYENSVLFPVSCFQYILVAAVFSIGPPYRRSTWTNGPLMLALCILSAFNLLVLLSPPKILTDILTLIPLPSDGKSMIVIVVLLNVLISLSFEHWGSEAVARAVGVITKPWKERRRVQDDKAYKTVEGGMN